MEVLRILDRWIDSRLDERRLSLFHTRKDRLPARSVPIRTSRAGFDSSGSEFVDESNAAVSAVGHAADVFAFAVGADHRRGILPLVGRGSYPSVICRAISRARNKSWSRTQRRARWPGSSGMWLGMPFSRRALARYSAIDSSSLDQDFRAVASLASWGVGQRASRVEPVVLRQSRTAGIRGRGFLALDPIQCAIRAFQVSGVHANFKTGSRFQIVGTRTKKTAGGIVNLASASMDAFVAESGLQRCEFGGARTAPQNLRENRWACRTGFQPVWVWLLPALQKSKRDRLEACPTGARRPALRRCLRLGIGRRCRDERCGAAIRIGAS